MAKAKKEETGPALPWPADRMIRKKTASLVPYARNARVHAARQVQQIATSIEQFGWTKLLWGDARTDFWFELSAFDCGTG